MSMLLNARLVTVAPEMGIPLKLHMLENCPLDNTVTLKFVLASRATDVAVACFGRIIIGAK